MRRRDLIKGLATLPAWTLSSNAEDKKRKGYPARRGPRGILRILLNGPFALVVDRKQPDRITFFCPVDPEKLHRFYFNSVSKTDDDGQDPERTHHFELLPEGLDIFPRKRAYIDQCFRDITFHTDRFVRTKNFVTIELPVPDTIGFIPPEQPVTFENDRRGSMPMNNLLEYRMTEPEQVTMISRRGRIRPRPAKSLTEEYQEFCRPSKTGSQSHSKACSEFEQEFESWEEADVRTFFFGVGVSEDVPPDVAAKHAIAFYNSIIQNSFPDVKGQQLIAIGDVRVNPTRARLMPAVWNQDPALSLYRPVTAVMECKVTGPHGMVP